MDKKLPKRPSQHEIDTQACSMVRFAFAQEKCWEYREVTGRDFGIDAIVERFENNKTTSEYLLLQIKGTEDDIDKDNPRFKLKTKELQYAEMFSDPVLLIYVSTKNPTCCYYVWLQEYIRVCLNRDNNDWRTQDSNTIYIPKDNIIGLSSEKLISIANYPKYKRAWLQYYLSLDGIGHELRVLLNDKTGDIYHDDFINKLKPIKELLEQAKQRTIFYEIDELSDAIDRLDKEIIEVLNFKDISNEMDIFSWETLTESIELLSIYVRNIANKFDDDYLYKEYTKGVITY